MNELAAKHRVPERLIHRIIMRESRYQPHLVSRGNYGLMQIKPATARGMGYRGSPAGLLDARTNMTYAVPYLANAYHIAGGDEDAAVRLYAGGYYYVAKRRGMLGRLQTAHAPAHAAAYAPAAPQTDFFGAAARAQETARAPEPAHLQEAAERRSAAVDAGASARSEPRRGRAKARRSGKHLEDLSDPAL